MDDFRALALSQPEAIEQDHFGSPSFRVQGKIFAQLSADGNEALVKLPINVQGSVLAAYPNDSWPEKHWGKHGWTRIRWRRLPREIVFDLVTRSWRAVAPRKPQSVFARSPLRVDSSS